MNHLNLRELACKDGTPYPYYNDNRLERLIQLFEDIRKLAGDKPIKILSAYRTVIHNKKIRGAKNSQHLYGRALDLQHSKMTNTEFYELIRSNVIELGIGGLGRYKTFVHVDIRPGDRIAYWSGSGLKDSQNA